MEGRNEGALVLILFRNEIFDRSSDVLKYLIQVLMMETGCIPSQVLEFSINNGYTPKQCQIIPYQMTYGKLKVRLLPSLSRKMILHE